MLALLAALLASTPAVEMAARATPASSQELVRGEVTSKGGPAEGMLKIVSGPVSQLVYWTIPKGNLRSRAEHERSLVQRAGEGAAVEVGAIAERKGLAGAALVWSARVERTWFASAVIDCGSHHVLLTTMGPDAALVRETEERSLSSLRCAR